LIARRLRRRAKIRFADSHPGSESAFGGQPKPQKSTFKEGGGSENFLKKVYIFATLLFRSRPYPPAR